MQLAGSGNPSETGCPSRVVADARLSDFDFRGSPTADHPEQVAGSCRLQSENSRVLSRWGLNAISVRRPPADTLSLALHLPTRLFSPVAPAQF